MNRSAGEKGRVRVAVRTRFGSLLLLPPGVEGRKEEREERLKDRRGVLVGVDCVNDAWRGRGRGVVLSELGAGRSCPSGIWDPRREMVVRLERLACRRL